MLPDRFPELVIEALHSGNYRKGQGALRISGGGFTDDRFCAFGVACDVAVNLGVGSWGSARVLGSTVQTYVLDGEGTDANPPALIKRALGLTDAQVQVLMKANDNPRSTLCAVAGVLEAFLEAGGAA